MSRPQSLAGSPPRKADLITRAFLIAVAFVGLLYAGFGLTPSSYGVLLNYFGAGDSGPIAGWPRDIRSDEWALLTPQFQIAVRNRFRRVNESSFYREDQRNYGALPLADWSLVFKPQMWAFFLLSPATAFSIYFALFMSAFLAGLYLLFRELGVPGEVAVAAALMVCFSGFCQFWWTTFLPLFAGFPWILLLVLRPMPWWKKALISTWVFPYFVLSHTYPPLLLTLAWCSIFLIVAMRPSLFRSPGDIAASAVGILAALAVTCLYLRDVIPIMRNTVYPGHRVSPPGTTPIQVVFSEFLPFLTFRLRGFGNLTGPNICEIGAVGSFLPLLTICLTRYRSLRDDPATRRALIVLLTGFTMITLWEVAPVPAWIGHVLLWDTSGSTRWLFASGFLLTIASLSIWRSNLISLHPCRLVLFAILGPIASVVLKIAWLLHKGESLAYALSNSALEICILGLAAAAVLVVWRFPNGWRAPVILGVLAMLNVIVFARFNPLQPAQPIFEVPDTPVIRELKIEAAASPDGVLVDPRFLGSILNGLGFRSINQYLLAPEPALFRRYFPTIDAERFNQLFNRSGYIQVIDGPEPHMLNPFQIGVPREVFLPIRNVRQLELGPALPNACRQPSVGNITLVASQDNALTIEGWAPWRSETEFQGLRVLSTRALRPGKLLTVTRPDVAEQLHDYRFVKSGFKLRIASADEKPLRTEELMLFAFGTSTAEGHLACCGCP